METTLSLPPELQLALEEIARRTGRDRSALIVDAVRAYVDQQGRPRARSIGTIERARVQSDQIEAWLAANGRPDEESGRPPSGGETPLADESPPIVSPAESEAASRPPRRLHVLEFDAGEVALQAADIDDYLQAHWHPDAEWRGAPET